MSGLTLGARRANEFARLLDAPERSDDPALAPYLGLAKALRAVPAGSGPSPEFRTSLRQRLVAVATVQPAGTVTESAPARLRAATSTWRVQKRIAVVAGGAAAATAIAGVGLGASRSLPGDAFYGVKRATERVQLAATSGQEAKGKRHLEFARTRLSEVEALVGRNSAMTAVLPGGVEALGLLTDDVKASTIIDTLRDMDSETRAGAEDLLAAAVHDHSTEPLAALNTFTRSQYVDLRAALPALPDAARARATQSLSLLTLVAGRSATVADLTQGAGTTGGTSGGASSQSPTPATPQPTRTSTPSPAHTGQPTPTPDATPKSPALPTLPTQLPTQVPTIPPLPSILPVPTSIPTLPDLNLPLLQQNNLP